MWILPVSYTHLDVYKRQYLDDRENFADFDGVLLDIRFPSGGEGIYEKYFSEIVTKKMYGDYLENGTGILLYLALALRYSCLLYTSRCV